MATEENANGFPSVPLQVPFAIPSFLFRNSERSLCEEKMERGLQIWVTKARARTEGNLLLENFHFQHQFPSASAPTINRCDKVGPACHFYDPPSK